MGKPCQSRSSTPKDDERGLRSPFTRRIQETHISIGLKKPPQMDPYDKTTNPNEHIKNIKTILKYLNVRGAVKCRLFAKTLRKREMTWYKSLKRESIESWKELCKQFTTHFIPSWRKPLFFYCLCLFVMMKCQQKRLPMWPAGTHLFIYIT